MFHLQHRDLFEDEFLSTWVTYDARLFHLSLFLMIAP